MIAKTRNVALLLAAGWESAERFRRGVIDYVRRKARWTITTMPETFGPSIRSLAGWDGDGVIANIRRKRDVHAAGKLGIPVVVMSGALAEGLLPRVLTDNEAIGRLGAEHLLDCGFRRAAFYGRRGAYDISLRRKGFVDRCSHAGAACATFWAPSLFGRWSNWSHAGQKLDGFLAGLRPPLGVMACDDLRARMVLDSCRRVGYRVPDDVAILGVDNNELICEFADPPLSSVARADRQMGYESAALLDRLMAGKPAPKGDILLSPPGLVRRRSTDVLAIEDPHVASAVTLIRERIGEPFGVEVVMRQASVSRRWLEQRFKDMVGCTIYQYICRTRAEHAKDLLAAPGKKMLLKDIAQACGFPNAKRFRLVFDRLTGQSPAQYRRSRPSRQA